MATLSRDLEEVTFLLSLSFLICMMGIIPTIPEEDCKDQIRPNKNALRRHKAPYLESVRVQCLGQEDPLTFLGIAWAWQLTPVFLPGESPWTEEPGQLQSRGSQSWTRLKQLSTHAHTIRKQHFIKCTHRPDHNLKAMPSSRA